MKMDEPEEINKKLAIELVEVRKQLFNSEKQKTSASGKNEPGLKSLRQKFNPDLPNPSLKRLIAIVDKIFKTAKRRGKIWKNMNE